MAHISLVVLSVVAFGCIPLDGGGLVDDGKAGGAESTRSN